MASSPHIVVDMTPLDSVHRTRGIGRYAQGLRQGFESPRSPQDMRLSWLRVPPQPPGPALRLYPRRQLEGALAMAAENLLSLEPVLGDAQLYHALGMEGVTWRTPTVATCHDIIALLMPELYLDRPSRRLFWPLYLQWLRLGARHILAISHHVKATLCARGVRAEKIDVVHHGLSPFWHPQPQAPLPPQPATKLFPVRRRLRPPQEF